MTGTLLVLLAALDRHAGDSRFCYPAIDTLAEEIGRTRRHTRHLLRQLVALELIERHIGGGIGRTARGVTNVYVIRYRTCLCGQKFDQHGRPYKERTRYAGTRPIARFSTDPGAFYSQGGDARPVNSSPPLFNPFSIALKRCSCGESLPFENRSGRCARCIRRLRR